MRFKVKAGKHYVKTGVRNAAGIPEYKIYKKGQVVESDIDLKEKFRGKFEQLVDHRDDSEIPKPKVAKAKKAKAEKEEVSFKRVKVADKQWDVLNEVTGSKMNDAALTKREAGVLVAELNG